MAAGAGAGMTGGAVSGPWRGRGVRVLVTAASRYGATTGIALAIAEEMARAGLIPVVFAPEEAGSVQHYDAVVLGSAVYSGHWLQQARDFVSRSEAELATRPLWLFSSGPVGDLSLRLARKMSREPSELPRLISATRPRGHVTFGGRLERRNLGTVGRLRLLLAPGLEGDFRDWAAIRKWAREIASQLSAPQALRGAP